MLVRHKEHYVPEVINKIYNEFELNARYSNTKILNEFGVNTLKVDEEVCFDYDYYIELTIKRIE